MKKQNMVYIVFYSAPNGNQDLLCKVYDSRDKAEGYVERQEKKSGKYGRYSIESKKVE